MNRIPIFKNKTLTIADDSISGIIIIINGLITNRSVQFCVFSFLYVCSWGKDGLMKNLIESKPNRFVVDYVETGLELTETVSSEPIKVN